MILSTVNFVVACLGWMCNEIIAYRTQTLAKQAADMLRYISVTLFLKMSLMSLVQFR